ncbi:MAG: right-handed parallel beta-helix repeat-containing protein [Polyangiaceae bacterium]
MRHIAASRYLCTFAALALATVYGCSDDSSGDTTGSAGDSGTGGSASGGTAGSGGGAGDASTDAPIPDAGPPPQSCYDYRLDPVEEGLDCGGPCAPCDQLETAKYYVATDGDDANPGTIDKPFATWQKLRDVMQPGDLAYIRGGTYKSKLPGDTYAHCQWQGISGTEQARIRIFAYPGEQPVLDLSDVSSTTAANGVVLQGVNYLWVRGLRITGLAQNAGQPTQAGMGILESDNNIVEHVEIDNIGGYGLYIGTNSDDNLILNSDAHHCGDLFNNNGEGANGFMQTGNTGGQRNVFSGCRAWWISDDGFDLFAEDGEVTIENCWAFWNGYVAGKFDEAGDGMGFKLGPTSSDQSGKVQRFIRNNLAAANRSGGFDQNDANTGFVFHNNLSYGHLAPDFGFGWFWDYHPGEPSHEFRNNVSYANRVDLYSSKTKWTDDHNSWNGITVKDSDFESLDVSLLASPRRPGGRLPIVKAFRPSAGSALIDKGVDVGLPYLGKAPDLGPFERE